MTTLVKIIRKYYEENSRYESGPPVRMIKELERDSLVLSDLEISDETIPVLTRFFNTKQAYEQVKRIEVNRSSGGKVNQRRSSSTLNLNGHKLFKDLLNFVGKCKRLEVLTFEHVDIAMPVILALCKALLSTSSPLRWLAFRNCDISGDEGLKELTPYLGKLELQVLGLECCNLTDASLPYIASILKAQQNNLDDLRYNATLRLDPAEDNVEILNEATSFVYSRGLVALSLWGNNITGKGALMFARLLRKNDWLLGLNLAENNINELNMAILIEELKNNAILQSILLRNNPGLEVPMATALCSSVMEKSKSVSKSLSEGFARLDVLEPRVSWLLKCWMTLQCEETRDLIQGRRLIMNFPDEAVRQSVLRKPLTKESPEDIYLKAYSVFNFLSDCDLSKPNLPVHPSGNQEDDDPVLYDFSGNGNARLSFDGQTRSSALLGAAERYNTTSTLTNSNASNPMVGQEYDRHEFSSTVKRVQEPFHELLFRPSVGSPVPFKHGAEYDESVDASVDHRPRQRLTKARQQADELDRAIAVPSPPSQRRDASNRRSGDIDGWEYWPDDKPTQREGRPPSRISMRPKSAPSVDYVRSSSHSDIPRFMRPKEDSAHRRSSSASRGEYHPKEAWGEREKITNRSPSPPRKAWCPSSYVPQASDGTRKRTSDKEQKPPSSAMTRYASPAMISHRRYSGSSARSRFRGNHNNTPPNPKPRKSTTAKYDEITNSVLAATRHLEQVSRRLCDVAESLSESAMMNVSNIHAQNVSNMHDVTPTRYRKSPSRDKTNVVNNHQADADLPSFPNQIFTDQEMENERLEEVVRQRMKARLRDYLSKELQSEWND